MKVKTRPRNKRKFKLAFTNRKEAAALSDSSHELSREILSLTNEEDKLLLSSWGLPPSIVWRYKSKGIESLFKWQLECLANERVLSGRNLVYSAPTSAGKTLVAEILMVKRVLELGKKAIMILPFVSVAREKMYSLQQLFGDAGVRVEGMMGSCNPPGGFAAVDIAVCTIEKANGLINRLLEEGTLSTVGMIVVDELHLIGDPDRGFLLELMLTKIKFMLSKQSIIESTDQPQGEQSSSQKKSEKINIQICGMSATLPNLNLLADWLDAELVITDFRPIPLIETIKIGDKVYDSSLQPVRNAHSPSLQVNITNDDDGIAYLSLETVLAGHSVLIFCPTRAFCEKTAWKIAATFGELGNPASDKTPEVGARLRQEITRDRIMGVLHQLEGCPSGLDRTLRKAVSFGVAFHHAGLTMDERDILEAAFKIGNIRVLVATTTLSAGVNLPARRVIISSPQVYNGKLSALDPLTYRQMCGRAGRNGIDTEGESILVCSSLNEEIGKSLIQSHVSAVTSSLLGSNGSLPSSMKRALLEVVASGVAKSPADVKFYTQHMLLSVNNNFKMASNGDLLALQASKTAVIEQCLQFLVDNEFIRLRKYDDPDKNDEYMVTQLGLACFASSLDPDAAILVFKELQKARECFVLENELHIVYQVTPIKLSNQWKDVNWYTFLNMYDALPPLQKRVGELVGVTEKFMLQAAQRLVSSKNPKEEKKLSVHQRFFTALALNDLVNEVPIADVSAKYEFNKGQLQSLQQGASTFAGMVTVFCNRLGWFNLEMLLSQFAPRLQFGVPLELCDLLKLTRLNGTLSRILYDAGIKTVVDLAKADPAHIEKILHRASSFSSTVHGDSVTNRSANNEGMIGQNEAHLLVHDAQLFYKTELGLSDQVEFGVRAVHTRQPMDTNQQIIEAPNVANLKSSHDQKDSVPLNDSMKEMWEELDSVFEDGDDQNGMPQEGNENEKDGQEVQSSQVPSSYDSATVVTLDPTPPDSIPVNENEAEHVKEEDSNTCSSGWLRTSTKCPNNPETVLKCSSLTDHKNGSVQNVTIDPLDLNNSVFMTHENSYSIFEDSFPSFDEKDLDYATERKVSTPTTVFKEKQTIGPTCGSEAENSENIVKRDEPSCSVSRMDNNEDSKKRLRDYDMSWNDEQIMAMLVDDAFNLSKNISIHERTPKKPKLKDTKEDSLSAPLFESCEEKMEVDDDNANVDSDKLNQQLSEENDNNGYSTLTTPTTEEEGEEEVAKNNSAVRVMEVNSNVSSKGEKGDAENDQQSKSTLKYFDIPNLESNVLDRKEEIGRGELFEHSNSSSSSCSNEIFEKSSDDEQAKPKIPAVVTSIITRSKSMRSRSTSTAVEPHADSDSDSAMDDDNDDQEEISKLPSLSVHGRDIKVKVTKVANRLPQSLFESKRPIGIAFKIVAPPKPTSTSSVRTGIGSRIISKPKVILPSTSNTKNEQQRYHSLALFNGGDFIWVFQWKNSEAKMKPTSESKRCRCQSSKIYDVFKRIHEARCPIVLLDAKDELKSLVISCGKDILEYLSCGVEMLNDDTRSSQIYDPKIAEWLWQCDESTVKSTTSSEHGDPWVKTDDLVCKHLDLEEYKIVKIRWSIEIKEAFMAWTFMDKLQLKLKENRLWTHFIEVEMPCIFPLLLMELNGFGLNTMELDRLKKILHFQATILELKAFQSANRQFNLGSPKDIKQILFRELGLRQPLKTRGTGKDVLAKLDHELAKIILEWRKVTCALQKMVIPFQKEFNRKTGRVHDYYSLFTTTGRVVMSEPSIQCIPRDFDLRISCTLSEIEDIKKNGMLKFGSKLDPLIMIIDEGIKLQQKQQEMPVEMPFKNKSRDKCVSFDDRIISMRQAFVACSEEFVILSADYSQLELRILAHLCQDTDLLEALNSDGGDVFKAIASSWKNLPIEQITNDIRQEAKAITYGIIYGMGPKTLAEQMDIDEASAKQFIADFMNAYPKIRVFLDQTVKSCKEKGYIETISGRRRFLPHINHKISQIRAQAERQAVNSQIQGSASDLVKRAMVGIQAELQQMYKMTAFPVDWSHSEKTQSTNPSYSHVHDKSSKFVPYFPILNLHDELIFEVHKKELPVISKVIRRVMESALTLTVRLPVVVKTGDSWGTLTPVTTTD